MNEYEINSGNTHDEPVIDITQGRFIHLIDVYSKSSRKIKNFCISSRKLDNIDFFEIKLDNKFLRAEESKSLLAFVYLNNSQLEDELTVLEILHFSASFKFINSRDDFILNNFSELIDDIGLNDFLKTKFKELNDEEKLKVMILSELITEKKVIIVDPPFDEHDETDNYCFDDLTERLKRISEKYKITIFHKKKYFRKGDFNIFEKIVVLLDYKLLFYGSEENIQEEIKKNNDFMKYGCDIISLLETLTSNELEIEKDPKYMFYINIYSKNKDKKLILQHDNYDNENIDVLTEKLNNQNAMNLILRSIEIVQKNTKFKFYLYLLFCLIFPLFMSLFSLIIQKMLEKTILDENFLLSDSYNDKNKDKFMFVIRNLLMANFISSFYSAAIIFVTCFIYFYEYPQRRYEIINGKYSKKSYILSFFIRCCLLSMISCAIFNNISCFFLTPFNSLKNGIIFISVVPIQSITLVLFLLIFDNHIINIFTFILPFFVLYYQPFTRTFEIFTSQDFAVLSLVKRFKNIVFSIVLLPFISWKIFFSYIYRKYLWEITFGSKLGESDFSLEPLNIDKNIIGFYIFGGYYISLKNSVYLCLCIFVLMVSVICLKLNRRLYK